MAHFAKPNFADLVLADRLPAGLSNGHVPVRIAATARDEALAPATGVVNSILIGALVWIGVFAVITLV